MRAMAEGGGANPLIKTLAKALARVDLRNGDLEYSVLRVSMVLIFALLYAGFWDKRLGVLGALGSTITFATTVTIIPFMPDGWDPSAGFPAMAGLVPFLMKDVVLLAVSIYLLKQDVVRALQADLGARVAKPRAG
jgi:uncharacterized membrane protein YkgB